MRITKINIPKTYRIDFGLDDIKMEKLGQIVILSGKNGSGKTRILNKIFEALHKKPKKTELDNARVALEQETENIEFYNNEIESFKKQLINTKIDREIVNLNSKINTYTTHLKNASNNIKLLNDTISWNYIETSEISENYKSVYFVPKVLTLTDSNQFKKHELIRVASSTDLVGMDNFQDGTFARIQVVQDRWFNATHQDSMFEETDKEYAINNYKKLNELIYIFLNTQIGRNVDGDATIFGFPLGKSNLSDGQKVLLQFCLAVFIQEAALKDLILIMDEPENHLHPSVIIETLERLNKCVSNGQIWIATHSIPILAHFDPSVIWYVEDGKVSYAGSIPEKVLCSLLGDENEQAKLQDFISLPSQFASSKLAFECLIEPKTVMTGSDDSQSIQIREELLKIAGKDMLRVLDFGAGKGRLLSNIFDVDLEKQESLIEKLDYIAYDINDVDKDQCISVITCIYGDANNRYFNDYVSLTSKYDKCSFDVIIMCNVLHEIDPKDWLNLFKDETGLITNLLADDGVLIIVEDHQMPIGEKAYQKGFIVLDTPQFKELFKITEKDKEFKFEDSRHDSRLKAHIIPKKYLIRIDESSRIDSLKSLSEIAKTKILDVRKKDITYKNGKVHGFWVQQFANAQLALSELTTQKM